MFQGISLKRYWPRGSPWKGNGSRSLSSLPTSEARRDLSKGLDPEEAQKLIDPVLQVMMDAVHRYEGTVNQVLG